MPVDPISQGLALATSVLDVAKPLVEKHLAESNEREHLNDSNAIQNGFPDADPDGLWRVTSRLCAEGGHPPTPGGGTGRRFWVSAELLHCMLLCIADGKRDRKYSIQAINAVMKK